MSSPNQILIAERLAGATVACIGDIMLDRYVYGTAERISAEAPVPVLHVERQTDMLGGVGNVVRNLATLNAKPTLIALAGQDEAGRNITEQLASLTGVTVHLLTEDDRPTTIKTRYVAAGQQLLRADAEDIAPIAPSTQARAEQLVEAIAPNVGAIVLSDYGKGFLVAPLLHRLIAIANTAGCPVVVDPKGEQFSIYRGADLITPNRLELRAATRLPVGGNDDIAAAARWVIAKCGIRNVLVTRGAEGMTLVSQDRSVTHLPTRAREVYDVSGAGDTVVAVMAASYAAGLDFPDAMQLANAAAGRVVGKTGTASVMPDELNEALRPGDHNKIVGREQLSAKLRRWRDDGLSVGFTNGCFDLIHPGHVGLLAWARQVCDRLIVGVNDDDSTRRLKGPNRPVQQIGSRERVLASLASVDLVVRFSEDTPLALIEAIRPDVLVKGADYNIDQVVGADLVQGYGGTVKLAPLEPGQSTTATIARLSR